MTSPFRAAALLLVAAAVACPGCGEASPAASSGAPTPNSEGLVNDNNMAASAAVSVAPGATRAIPSPNASATLAPGPDGVIETSFDDVKFEMDKTEPFREELMTDRVKSLFTKRIRIRGYMYPTLRQKGLKQFVLVRDNLECCFGPGAALYDCILVTTDPEKATEYSIRPIAVEGNFRFQPLKGPDGTPLAIYQMADAEVTRGE